MLKLYSFSVVRNKFGLKGKSSLSLKKELFNHSPKCYLCNKDFEFRQLELEHRVPVEVGGHLYDYGNIDLVCIKCHRKKTTIDLTVIRILKSTKILFSKGQSFVPLDKLRETYLYLFGLVRKGYDSYNEWQYGTNGIDYEQEFIGDNRQ